MALADARGSSGVRFAPEAVIRALANTAVAA